MKKRQVVVSGTLLQDTCCNCYLYVLQASILIHHVNRADNVLADKLSNEAADVQEAGAFTSRTAHPQQQQQPRHHVPSPCPTQDLTLPDPDPDIQQQIDQARPRMSPVQTHNTPHHNQALLQPDSC